MACMHLPSVQCDNCRHTWSAPYWQAWHPPVCYRDTLSNSTAGPVETPITRAEFDKLAEAVLRIETLLLNHVAVKDCLPCTEPGENLDHLL